MTSGTITVRVRPIRVAFLVDANDRQGIFRSFELNSIVWGGGYNPIIPVYRRPPITWRAPKGARAPTPDDIVSGYIDAFDPDIIVPIGTCSERSFQVGNREIVEESKFLGEVEQTGSPAFGIGVIDLLDDFVEKEMKFRRNDDLHLAIPKMPSAYKLFLASIFGVIPNEIEKEFSDLAPPAPMSITVRPTLNSYLREWTPQRIFPRHLSSWSLEYCPAKGATLFVCDASSPMDVIDFWNLRAAGNHVIPIPIQTCNGDSVQRVAKKFIEDAYKPEYNNIYDHAVVQRSRSLSEKSVHDFCKSLNANWGSDQRPKYSIRHWYPRLWDAWARENSFDENVVFPYAYEEELQVVEGDERLSRRSLNPKFELSRWPSENPRFANGFDFRFYSAKEPMAEVIPEGTSKLSSAIGNLTYRNWRFSKSGPVFLAHYKDELMFVELPRAENVMTEWFRGHGWNVSLSGPGRIAKQMIMQLGGTFGTSWLAHAGVIQLLSELEKEAGLSRPAVIGKLKAIIKNDEMFFSAERFLEILIEAKALRLGSKIQCPVCTRYNWYELNMLKYHLDCRFCLSEFDPPTKSPKEMEWTYRSHGPFASSIAQGSFTVLLTLRFIRGDYDCGVTPLFSYTAVKGEKLLEADLTCIYKRSTWREASAQVVHAECKSFNFFESKDVERMKALSNAFPGSVLVFSTLNNSLTKKEIRLIGDLAKKERRKRFQRKPFSPIVILTGVELFCANPFRDCWKGKGGLYDVLSNNGVDRSDLPALSDSTQQLYLEFPSWHTWLDAELTKRKRNS